MSRPRDLFEQWELVRKRTLRASRIFLFLDFDGTLAPIRRRPEQVWLASDLRRFINSIGRSGTTVAIISGRGLTDVRRRAGVRAIWYAGAHGYFLQSPHGKRISLLTAAQQAQIDGVLRSLRTTLRRLPGIQVEPKEATVAVHYRRASPSSQRHALRILTQVVNRSPNLKIMYGKKVWEILPSARVDKWTAASAILRKEKWSSSRDLLFYFGDDTTDEAIFGRMKGISVAVGKRSGTAARYFLCSPAEVKKFLRRWKELID